MTVNLGGMIERDSLNRQFDELADERLIYVCAPAGYGKTVAVRQWLDKRGRARAILSLDEYDNVVDRFCERFCAVLHASQPQNKALAEIVSHPSFAGAPDEFALRAIAAFSEKRRMALVIDDLHLLRDEKVLSLLLVFLKRLPENCRIILVSRSELPPGFSDLWIRGSLVKITEEQLSFTEKEIMQLYKKRGNLVTLSQAGDIRRLTGGWAIGISAFLLTGEEPSGRSFKLLEEFIRSDIWSKWDEATREFMLCTSAARELEPSLCDALTGGTDSEKRLRDLMLDGAFVYQTSDGVYHYHHLFRDFLRRMLAERGEERLHRLLKREGEWHLHRQDFYGAADCFIRCCDHDGIAKCFDLLEITDRNDFVIERMLHVIKNPEILAAADTYPFLYYMQAWAAFAEGRANDMAAHMDRYYARFPEIAARDPGHAHNIFFMRLMDFRAGLQDLMKEISALPALPVTDGIRGSITMNMPLLHRSSRDFSELAGEDTEANVGAIAEIVRWLLGEEAGVLTGCLTAGLLYEQGYLEKAYTYAQNANAVMKPHFAPELKFNAMSILIYILDAMGEADQAEQALCRLERAIEQDKAYYLSRNYRAMRVRRRLAQGDASAAEGWLSEYAAAQHEALDCFGMYGTFTTCRAYICVGDYDAAIQLLTKARELVQGFNRHIGIIETHVLLSIAYWKKRRGFQEEALRHLESAVSLAYKHKYTQIFVNNSAELAGMLHRLHKRAAQPGKGGELSVSFIKLLYMNAMEHQDAGLTSGQPVRSEKYTDKQKTVMKLLCEGNSYREIAESMGIKLPTLRSHIALVYKKLDVTNEAAAIMKIKSLGILNEMQAE